MVQVQPKTSNYRQPRKPRTQSYAKVNAYTLYPSKQQIGTLILFIALLVTHQVFVTPQVYGPENAILWALTGFRYALLIMIGYDYYKLTTKDPVDRVILNETLRYKYNTYELRQCSLCATTVQCSSHHCMTCNRCTQDFDHHCKYLNNCIGVRNYEYFMRILIIFSIFISIGIGMSVWVLIQNGVNRYFETYRVVIIVIYIVVSGIVIVIVGSLLIFHLYISCCANITTLQFIHPNPKQQQLPKLNYLVVQPTPLSAQQFRKQVQYRQSNANPERKINLNVKETNQPMRFYRK